MDGSPLARTLLALLLLASPAIAPPTAAAEGGDDEPPEDGSDPEASGDEDSGDEDEASDASRRSPQLSPPIWKSGQAVLPRQRTSVGPALFPTRLGPIPHQDPPSPMASLSAQACNACHGEIHDQWARSGHATASSNVVYVAAMEALGNPPECHNCHLPLENQRATLYFGPGSTGPRSDNPAYSPTLAQEGVTCAACHVRDGIIYGPRDLPPSDSPHPVARADVLRGTAACAFCHQVSLQGAEEHPFLDTVGEWLRSPWGEADIACQQCHMPRVSGVIAGSRYAAFASHEWLGSRSPEAMRRAFTLEVNLRESSLERGQRLRGTATLLNTGAGHAVPTGDPAHQLEVRFEVEDASGAAAKGADPKSHWLLREVDSRPPFTQKSDSRLAAASSRVFDYTASISRKLRPGTFTLKVSVNWWALSPERAAAVGLDEDAVRVQVLQQRIPFSVF